MTYVVGHHKRKILRYRKEKPMAKEYTGELQELNKDDRKGLGKLEGIDEKDVQELIDQANVELGLARAAAEAARVASVAAGPGVAPEGAAEGAAGGAEAQAKIAGAKKDEARYYAARAIVYAKAAQAAAA